MSLHPEQLSPQENSIDFGPIKKGFDQSNREIFFIKIICHPSQLEQAKQQLFSEHDYHDDSYIEWQYIISERIKSGSLTEYEIQGARARL